MKSGDIYGQAVVKTMAGVRRGEFRCLRGVTPLAA